MVFIDFGLIPWSRSLQIAIRHADCINQATTASSFLLFTIHRGRLTKLLGTCPHSNVFRFCQASRNISSRWPRSLCRTDSTSRLKAHKSKAGGWRSSPTISPTSIPSDSSATWPSCSRAMPRPSSGARQSPGGGTINDIGGGVQFRQTVTDFSPGPLKKTGNPSRRGPARRWLFRRPKGPGTAAHAGRQFSPHGRRRLGHAAGIPGPRRGQLADQDQPHGGPLGNRFLGQRQPRRHAAGIADRQAGVAGRPGQERREPLPPAGRRAAGGPEANGPSPAAAWRCRPCNRRPR